MKNETSTTHELGNNANLMLAAGLSEIPVYGSEAVWVQNANYPNNYTLWKQDLILGSRCGFLAVNFNRSRFFVLFFGWQKKYCS